MNSIYQKAKEYSSNKCELAMSKAIAQAYLDGYRDGYEARKNKEEAGFVGDDVEFVDLGLPSGTLWAKESLKDDDGICLLTFDEANMLTIPSTEQWEELLALCTWQLIDNQHGTIGAKCVGPNGGFVLFSFFESYIKPSNWREFGGEVVRFWLKNVFDATDNKGTIARFSKKEGDDKLAFRQVLISAECKLPVRLVKDAL